MSRTIMQLQVGLQAGCRMRMLPAQVLPEQVLPVMPPSPEKFPLGHFPTNFLRRGTSPSAVIINNITLNAFAKWEAGGMSEELSGGLVQTGNSYIKRTSNGWPDIASLPIRSTP